MMCFFDYKLMRSEWTKLVFMFKLLYISKIFIINLKFLVCKGGLSTELSNSMYFSETFMAEIELLSGIHVLFLR